jgi:hypothetical protein
MVVVTIDVIAVSTEPPVGACGVDVSAGAITGA